MGKKAKGSEIVEERSPAIRAWIAHSDVTLKCFQLERWVKHFVFLDQDLLALTLIRQAYDSTLADAMIIKDAIMRRARS